MPAACVWKWSTKSNLRLVDRAILWVVSFAYAMGTQIQQSTKIGIRQFRENLSTYLESKSPVAITRHGATIGIYVPTRPKPTDADLDAFRVAGKKMRELIASANTTEDELAADFKRARRSAKR